MPLLMLIRHGENNYTKTHKLAGRLPKVHLNEHGQKQAQALADALTNVPIKAIYSVRLKGQWKLQNPLQNPSG